MTGGASVPSHASAIDVADVVAAHGLGPHQAFVPLGMWFGWVLENQLQAAELDPTIGQRFARRESTGPTLFEELGGVLGPSLLGRHAAEFADSYIGYAEGQYFDDLEEWFPVPTMFHVFDTWENYEWTRIKLVARYSEWRSAL